MARKQTVEVDFNFKQIASLSGLTFNPDDRLWYGTKESIKKFEERKEKEQQIHDATKRSVQNNEEVSFNIEKGCDNTSFWDTIDISSISNLELVKNIYDYGLPGTPDKRINILQKFSAKKPGEYPIYYDDLLFYSEKFKEAYPREYIEYLLTKNDISGRDLKAELQEADITDEENALLYFVLTQE